MFCLVCVFICVAGACGGQKRVLELKLQTAVHSHVGTGDNPGHYKSNDSSTTESLSPSPWLALVLFIYFYFVMCLQSGSIL